MFYLPTDLLHQYQWNHFFYFWYICNSHFRNDFLSQPLTPIMPSVSNLQFEMRGKSPRTGDFVQTNHDPSDTTKESSNLKIISRILSRIELFLIIMVFREGTGIFHLYTTLRMSSDSVMCQVDEIQELISRFIWIGLFLTSSTRYLRLSFQFNNSFW